ncbi:type II toxin-antitoxin system VapC family toxin [Ferrovibrio sp.]|uniref:type II toxin-antitoxin system VapC family toxin n=1 Tax=Ferrovibrio sp. TaxID=1917215 RepID=UPI001B5701E5|nr:type II toxin-antitoxin system VapC family toxin [Ferrovibrio sp.]MBP7064389.1 type II toxin-antitoxin system VapC family toxin [Ferrovibrio sp.]
MAVIVVDASALAAVIYGEPEASRMVAALAGTELNAPLLLRAEMANICLMKSRRAAHLHTQLFAAFDHFQHLRITYHDVADRAAVNLAERHDLTFYDACYLWLANQLDCRLISLDRKLLAAVASGR